VLVLVAVVAGCGPSVDSVKDGTFEGREQTTLGNAFEAAFSETTWELKESANKTQFVEFTGKAKKIIMLETSDDSDLWVIPKNGEVLFQFVIKRDDTFDISYAEAKLDLNPKVAEGLKKMLASDKETEAGLGVVLAAQLKPKIDARNVNKKNIGQLSEEEIVDVLDHAYGL
jgi:hypothetical protein